MDCGSLKEHINIRSHVCAVNPYSCYHSNMFKTRRRALIAINKINKILKYGELVKYGI